MIAAAGLAGLAACAHKEAPAPAADLQRGPSASVSVGTEAEDRRIEMLKNFIDTTLTGPYGVFTNLQDTGQSAEAASGHEVLSESASLLMRAAVLEGEQNRFAKQWELAKQTFDMNSGFSYRYSPKQDKRYPVNAAVDDLRVIRALYEAGEAFGEERYTEEADKYGRRFYQHNVKDGYMFDFYDENYKMTNSFVTLCYINLGTLQKLSIPSESKEALLHNMENILEEGYLSDEFPFYEPRFDYDTGEYSSGPIHTVESLLTILSLSEVHLEKPSSIRYLREQVEAGTLYGQYTREGVPANDIRSTAIYAITAMIGAEIGDEELYRSSIARMDEFRIGNSGSLLYGGFGDEGSQQAYSFDNLMALLAYNY